MRPANLLPADLARGAGRQLPVPVIAAAGAGVAVVGALAFGYTTAHNQVSQRQHQLDTLNAQIAAIPRPKPVHTSISSSLGVEKDARQTALDSALTGRLAWYSVLRELSLVVPDDVWLLTMSGKSTASADPAADPSAATSATTGLTMTGYTYSQEGVARLLSRLALVPQLANVQLQSSTGATVGERPVVNFSISATVTGSGTAGGS
jgi:Tfp pilus assembly protein PilN